MNPLAEERDVDILEDTISQTKIGHDSETQRGEQIANLGVRLCREIELVALAQRGDSLLSESHSLRPQQQPGQRFHLVC
jgi:hypothetical protein